MMSPQDEAQKCPVFWVALHSIAPLSLWERGWGEGI